ncbi:PspA/IM30 family protein [Altererythrobacter sp.]
MIHIAVRIRELAASNLDTLVGKAGNPQKMLRLLRTEIEESLVALHSDLARAQRKAAQLADKARQVEEDAQGWTVKAKTAVDHKREDLARSALLAREDGLAHARALEAEADQTSQQAGEIEQAIAQLESKREDVNARLQSAVAERPAPTPPPASTSVSDSKATRLLDRIDRIERRTNFANENQAEAAPVDIDVEIAALQREADIGAELAAMKSASKSKPARKKAK